MFSSHTSLFSKTKTNETSQRSYVCACGLVLSVIGQVKTCCKLFLKYFMDVISGRTTKYDKASAHPQTIITCTILILHGHDIIERYILLQVPSTCLSSPILTADSGIHKKHTHPTTI